jgi:5-aminolevulinate synthase
MGKALAIQSARVVGSKTQMAGASAVLGVRTVSSHSKAKIHTSRPKEARAVDPPIFARESGMFIFVCPKPKGGQKLMYSCSCVPSNCPSQSEG